MSQSRVESGQVSLRDVVDADLPLFFKFHGDPAAIQRAAYTPRDRDAFMDHWAKILRDDGVICRAILCRRQLAGYLVCFRLDDRQLVGYWLGRAFWGRGVATEALTQFLTLIETRPLHAFVARRNVASVRVLEKCGFTATDERVLDSANHGKVDEWIMTLTSR